MTEQQLKQIVPVPTNRQFYYVNLHPLANAHDTFTEAMAVMLIVAWIKVFLQM